jgi:hypothetical protein
MLDLQGDRPRPLGPYDQNLENGRKLKADWRIGRHDPAATRDLLATLREASPEDASAFAVTLINQKGIDPSSLWDAVMLYAAELLMLNPGILSIHATTASNALHFIYRAAGDDTTRRLALLQAVGWMPLFRGRVKPTGTTAIDSLEPGEHDSKTHDPETIAAILETLGQDRHKAATQTYAYLSRGGSADLVFDAARRLIFHKGRDSHDYKYGAALWEESLLSTDARVKTALVASSMFNLTSPKTPDSPLMIRARAAITDVLH